MWFASGRFVDETSTRNDAGLFDVHHDEKLVDVIDTRSCTLVAVLAPVGMYEEAPEPVSTCAPQTKRSTVPESLEHG
jgi:hypothetical protein